MKKIAIHSVPRSGSSWVGQIFNSSPDVNFKFQPLFSYAFKDILNAYSSNAEINHFFNSIAQSNDEFLLQQDKIDKGIYPCFKKNENYTHIVYKEVRYHHILENMLKINDEIIVIGLVRNPYAVINSFLNAPREFRKDLGWKPMEEWEKADKKNLGRQEEFYGYMKWKEVLFTFKKLQKLYPQRFYLLNYDDLLSHTTEEVKKIFKFCEIQITQQTEDFLAKSTSKNLQDAYSVYKEKSQDIEWKNTLDSSIRDKITVDLQKLKLEEYVVR